MSIVPGIRHGRAGDDDDMRIDAPPTLERQVDQLRQVMVAAHLGAFRLWVDESDEAHVHWDPSMYLLHGLDPAVPIEHPAEALRSLHRDDVLRFIDAYTRVARGEHIEFDYRVVLDGGALRVLRIRTDCFDRDSDGRLW